jgi:hypothetical protein
VIGDESWSPRQRQASKALRIFLAFSRRVIARYHWRTPRGTPAGYLRALWSEYQGVSPVAAFGTLPNQPLKDVQMIAVPAAVPMTTVRAISPA